VDKIYNAANFCGLRSPSKKVEATFENAYFGKIKKNFLTIKSTYLFLVRKNTKNAIFSINTARESYYTFLLRVISTFYYAFNRVIP